MRVRDIHVTGATHTKHDVLLKELAPLRSATSLDRLAHEATAAAKRLNDLGVFEAADLYIERVPPSTTPDAAEAFTQPLADVHLTVVEKKRLAGAKTGVHTSNGETSMDAEVSVRNYFGRAERLALHLETGQHKSSSASLTASRQHYFGPGTNARAELKKQLVSHQKHSSYSEKLRGGSATACFGDARDAGGAHELEYELMLREVCQVPTKTASWSILQQRGFSLKNALRHSYTRSTLDSDVLPAAGARLRVTNELAVGASALYRKHVLEASAHVPLAPARRPGLAFGLAARIGIVRPIGGGGGEVDPTQRGLTNPEAPPVGVCVSDRFFLGGLGGLAPFPGFRTCGVGPHEVRHTRDGHVDARTPRDALGGDTLAVVSASLSSPLGGQLGRSGVRAQLYASAGTLSSMGGAGATLRSAASALVSSTRACLGFGLVVPTQLGRLEVGLTQVVRRVSGDVVQRSGLQLGLVP